MEIFIGSLVLYLIYILFYKSKKTLVKDNSEIPIDSNSKITILGNLLPMVAKGFCKKFIALLLASAAHATDSCPSRFM